MTVRTPPGKENVEIRRLRATVLEEKFARTPQLGAHFFEFLCYQEIHLLTSVVADRAARSQKPSIQGEEK